MISLVRISLFLRAFSKSNDISEEKQKHIEVSMIGIMKEKCIYLMFECEKYYSIYKSIDCLPFA